MKNSVANLNIGLGLKINHSEPLLFAILKTQLRISMTNEDQTQNDEDFDYGCECAMTLLNEPTEDCLNDLIDELDEDGMIATEVVYGLLATILMSINEEDHEGDEH